MNLNDLEKQKINFWTGEFSDNELENEYFKYDIGNSIKYIKPLLLILGVLYFLFIIPDYFAVQESMMFYKILINRTLFLFLIIMFYMKLKAAKSYEFYYRWITIYEILIYMSFLFILYFYETPNLVIQAFGVILLIICVFLVPNRWLNSVAVAVFFISGFLILSKYLTEAYYIREKSAVAVYLILVVLLSGYSSLRTNHYKRTQYIQQKQLLKMAETDKLTGIYNRFKFEQELNKIYIEGQSIKQASIILLDIDDFKKVNDEFGHLKGDEVLIDLAVLLKTTIGNEGIVARWGGEEFIILLLGKTIEEAVELASIIKTDLSRYDFHDISKITCSFGVAGICEYFDKNTLLSQVDKRLYKAKSQGKNRIISQ